MARATKGTEDIGRGVALPPAASTNLDSFIVENTADPVGEPDGLWYRTNGNWILGQALGTSGVSSGATLPAAPLTPFDVFVVENTVDPVGTPDGLYFVYLGNWVQAAPA